MACAKDIPPEIWSVIFDLALDASVTPHEICTQYNFPQLNQHLQSPKFFPLVDHSWANLRLVCRAFKALAGSSPHYFMDKESGLDIPTSTRAVYIGVSENVVACMERLARSSSIKHHQIVTLNIIRGYSYNPTSEGPLAFLEYSSALPNLRTLVVNFGAAIDLSCISTWQRLNDAFPFLSCLALRGRWRTPNTPLCVIEPVVFERVEILELDQLNPRLGVEFPKLRYLSLERFSKNEREVVAGCPGIEALLFRGVKQGVSLDWKQLPNLRMLGLPASHLGALAPCPVDHPWSELCIFVPPHWALRHVKATIERRPSTTRITIDLKSISRADLDLISRGCAAAGIELTGSPYSRFRRRIVHIATNLPPSFVYALTQGVVDVAVTGAFFCFVCAAGVLTCCGTVGRRRR